MPLLAFTSLVFLGSFFAGLLGALTGLGGGVVLIPLLTLVFHVDLRYAIGASLVSVIATSSGAAAAYVRDGFSNVRIGMGPAPRPLTHTRQEKWRPRRDRMAAICVCRTSPVRTSDRVEHLSQLEPEPAGELPVARRDALVLTLDGAEARAWVPHPTA
jgi:hypothetical protein